MYIKFLEGRPLANEKLESEETQEFWTVSIPLKQSLSLIRFHSGGSLVQRLLYMDNMLKKTHANCIFSLKYI